MSNWDYMQAKLKALEEVALAAYEMREATETYARAAGAYQDNPACYSAWQEASCVELRATATLDAALKAWGRVESFQHRTLLALLKP